MKAIKAIQKLNRPYNLQEWIGDDGIQWLDGKTVKEMVHNCNNGNWLFCIGRVTGVNIRRLTIAKALCAKEVEHFINDERSTNAINAAIDFGKGIISDKESLWNYIFQAKNAYEDAHGINESAIFAAKAAYEACHLDYVTVTTSIIKAYKKSNFVDITEEEILKKSADICREVFGEELITILNKNSI